MSAESQPAMGAYERLYELLPDLVCGVIWLVNIVGLVLLSTTRKEASDAADMLVKLLKPIAIPEIAIGFLLVISGVMLPYALGRALNPLASGLLNLAISLNPKLMRVDSLPDEHYTVAAQRIFANVGVTMPDDEWTAMFEQFLEHARSPSSRALQQQYRQINDKAHLAFPVSILTGILIYTPLRNHLMIGMLAGAGVACLTLIATSYLAIIALHNWNVEVMLAFLVASGPLFASQISAATTSISELQQPTGDQPGEKAG